MHRDQRKYMNVCKQVSMKQSISIKQDYKSCGTTMGTLSTLPHGKNGRKYDSHHLSLSVI